jgi:uncharacterized protein
MRHLIEADIDRIAVGAAILGSGGGGDPHIGKLMAKQAIKAHGPVRLIDVDEVPDAALVIPSAMMGAPAVMLEKLPNGGEPEMAFRALENYLGKKADAVISIEAGGLNSCIPIYTAACLGLPLVDGDGMGRAFPELPMVSFSVGGVPATPMVVCDEKGNKMVLETIDNTWSEILSRTATVAMGLSSMLGIYSMDGATLKRLAIRGTISLAEAIGEKILEAAKSKTSAVDSILEITRGFRLFEGKIVDILRDLSSGFIRGKVKLEGIDSCKGEFFEVDFQNENLVGRRDGKPVAMTPDLITVLDKEKGMPITTENLKYGQRTVVMGMPCNPFWRSEAGLNQVGPRYFKYDLDYAPIETLAGGRG